MALFVGHSEAKIDGKHRLPVGSAFREQMEPEADGKDFIMILGPNKRLRLYPDRYFRRMLKKLKRSPLPTRDQAKLTLFFALARDLKPDAQGRVVIPQVLMDKANLDGEVTLIGNGDHIELWRRDDWSRLVEEGMDEYDENVFSMAERMMAVEDDED